MNISKKLDRASEMLLWELKFALQYHLGWTHQMCLDFLDTAMEEKKLKNYWLQKREIKSLQEHNAKLDEIAKLVTKYISSRKAQNKG